MQKYNGFGPEVLRLKLRDMFHGITEFFPLELLILSRESKRLAVQQRIT